MNRPQDIGVLILAGGRASRLPGKLELDAHGVPLIVRVYRNCAGQWPISVCGGHALAAETQALLPVPFIADRRPGRGPLEGIISAFERLEYARVFVVAGDLPNITIRELSLLLGAWRRGDRATVAWGESGAQPLVALYDRATFLREAPPIEERGGGVREVAARLHARYVTLANEVLTNVNTPEEYQRAFGRAAS